MFYTGDPGLRAIEQRNLRLRAQRFRGVSRGLARALRIAIGRAMSRTPTPAASDTSDRRCAAQ